MSKALSFKEFRLVNLNIKVDESFQTHDEVQMYDYIDYLRVIGMNQKEDQLFNLIAKINPRYKTFDKKTLDNINNVIEEITGIKSDVENEVLKLNKTTTEKDPKTTTLTVVLLLFLTCCIMLIAMYYNEIQYQKEIENIFKQYEIEKL